MKDRRTSITVPIVMDSAISKHMDNTGIKTWNAALWDLVRLGLKSTVKDDVK